MAPGPLPANVNTTITLSFSEVNISCLISPSRALLTATDDVALYASYNQIQHLHLTAQKEKTECRQENQVLIKAILDLGYHGITRPTTHFYRQI